eukprot:scaffold3797_cov91-Skeletonema_dohrnii-CCMP3373.AAC.13
MHSQDGCRKHAFIRAQASQRHHSKIQVQADWTITDNSTGNTVATSPAYDATMASTQHRLSSRYQSHTDSFSAIIIFYYCASYHSSGSS